MKLTTAARRSIPVFAFLRRVRRRHHDSDDYAVREAWEHEGKMKGLAEGVGGITSALAAGMAVLAASDAVRHDERAWDVAGRQRALWIALIIGLPIVGPLLYL